MANEDIPISLTGDEALVLFDLLHRWEGDGEVGAPRHDAERVALWSLSALLERVLWEPLDPRYAELVSAARARLTASE